MSKKLEQSVTVPMNKKVSDLLFQHNIITAWDIKDFDQKKGWITELEEYTFNNNITIETPCAFYGGVYKPDIWSVKGGLCTMGIYSYSHSPLPEEVVVGRYCSLAKGLKFLDFSHPTDWLSSSVAFFKPLHSQSHSALATLIDRQNFPIERLDFNTKKNKAYPIIGHDVWIGENVTLSMGIEIGTGAIIASNAVITKDVPAYSIVGGNPMKIIKYRFSPSIIKRLLKTFWWEYDIINNQKLNVKDVETFLNELETSIKDKSITKLKIKFVSLPNALL